MRVQKNNGGRPLPRGQRFTIFAVLVLFCVFSVQFWVHENRVSTQHYGRGKSAYVKAVQSTSHEKSPGGQLSTSSGLEDEYDMDNSRSFQDLRQDNPLFLDELKDTVEECEDAGRGKLPLEECRKRIRMNINPASLHQPLRSSSSPPPPPPSSLTSLPSSPSILHPTTPPQKFAIGERIKSPEKEDLDKNNYTTTNIQIQPEDPQQQQENSSIDFMPLKDVKEPSLSDTVTTWFMSSIRKPLESGTMEELEFPSELSQGRLLCLKGSSDSDGTLNEYGFAPKDRLPPGAVLMPGITLVADNYWDYHNIWHGMSALAPFAAGRQNYGCGVPQRLLMYHWGEVVDSTSLWVEKLLHAAFGKRVEVDTVRKYYERKAAADLKAGHGEATGGGKGIEGPPSEPVACLEHAYVNRRGLGRSSLPRLQGIFETLRCRAWNFCKVEAGSRGGSASSLTSTTTSAFTTAKGIPSAPTVPHVTLFLRTGARAFRNSSEVIRVMEEACTKNSSRCTLEIAYAANLTFCQQVALMRRTDLLVTTHGAQMTNTMFMPKGAAVMEFMPMGWLELAGVGQYIYSWLADWAQLRHEGLWRDPEGPSCPYPTTETLQCFFFYKDREVGFNSTYTVEWMNKVLTSFEGGEVTPSKAPQNNACACDSEDNKPLNTGQL